MTQEEFDKQIEDLKQQYHKQVVRDIRRMRQEYAKQDEIDLYNKVKSFFKKFLAK